MKVLVIGFLGIIAGAATWFTVQRQAGLDRVRAAADERSFQQAISDERTRLDWALDEATARNMNLKGRMSDVQYIDFLSCHSTPPQLDKNKRKCETLSKRVKAQEDYDHSHPAW